MEMGLGKKVKFELGAASCFQWAYLRGGVESMICIVM